MFPNESRSQLGLFFVVVAVIVSLRELFSVWSLISLMPADGCDA